MYNLSEITNKILCGDSLTQLKQIPDECIDTVICSPPYWALRDYKSPPQIWDAVNGCEHDFKTEIKKWHADRGAGPRKEVFDDSFQNKGTEHAFCCKCNAWKGSLGLEPTFQLYIKHLIEIFNQVKRVLKKTGSCWVNIGDTYQSTAPGTKNTTPTNTGNKMAKDNFRYDSGLPAKSLCLIPQRFAIAMVDAGWICRNTIIWYKPNCMPSSAKDRFTVDFEYLFFFVKSQRYYFDTQYEIMDTPKSGWQKQRENGVSNMLPRAWTNDAIPMTGGKKINFQYSALGRIKRCVWKIPTQPYSEAHFATFPPALVETPLKACCPEYVCRKCGKPREKIVEKEYEEAGWSQNRQKCYNTYGHKIPRAKITAANTIGWNQCDCNAGFDAGICLDPFIGSGTVGLVAMQNARNFIGIELSQAYIDMAMKRLQPYLLQTRLY